MKLLKNEWPQLLVLAVPFCAAALFWNKLPERMPIHWDAQWQVNGYAGKAFATLFLPCLNIGMAALIGLLPLIDPKLRKSDEATRASLWRTTRAIRLAITSFLSLTALAVLAVSLRVPINMGMLMEIVIALLFMLTGNFLTKLRPNYFFGIRTPWTLESPQVWMKTHRLAGHLMVAGGLLLLALSFIVPATYYFYYVFGPVLILMLLPPVVYSYLWYKAEKGA